MIGSPRDDLTAHIRAHLPWRDRLGNLAPGSAAGIQCGDVIVISLRVPVRVNERVRTQAEH